MTTIYDGIKAQKTSHWKSKLTRLGMSKAVGLSLCKMAVKLGVSHRQVSRTLKRSFRHLPSELESGPQSHVMSFFSRNIWWRDSARWELRRLKSQDHCSLKRHELCLMKWELIQRQRDYAIQGIIWSLSNYETSEKLTQQVPTTGLKKFFADIRGIWTSKRVQSWRGGAGLLRYSRR